MCVEPTSSVFRGLVIQEGARRANLRQRSLSVQNWTLPSVTMSDTNWSLKERCTTDDMSTVSAGIPVILLFLTRSLRSSRRKAAAQRPLNVSQTNYHLNKGFPHVFIAYFILSESNSSVKIVSIPWTTTYFLKGGIFSNVVIFS